MKVALAIPYRGTDYTRIQAYQRTEQQLLDLFPWSKIRVFDSDRMRDFNISQARNNAVRANMGVDVVVLCDADSIPEAAPLREAILRASTSDRVYFPFDTVKDITKFSTVRVGNWPFSSLKLWRQYGPSQGGCFVFRPEVWWQLGGMDERLGWGYEDRAFLVCSETLLGGSIIIPGNLWCLWHERGQCFKRSDQQKIYDEYLGLRGNPEGLRNYIREREGLRVV